MNWQSAIWCLTNSTLGDKNLLKEKSAQSQSYRQSKRTIQNEKPQKNLNTKNNNNKLETKNLSKEKSGQSQSYRQNYYQSEIKIKIWIKKYQNTKQWENEEKLLEREVTELSTNQLCQSRHRTPTYKAPCLRISSLELAVWYYWLLMNSSIQCYLLSKRNPKICFSKKIQWSKKFSQLQINEPSANLEIRLLWVLSLATKSRYFQKCL